MYKIYYDDNTIFKGGSPENSKWKEINKPIKKIEYEIINIGKVILENYEKYNHIIKIGNYIIGNGSLVIYVKLIGIKGNRITICFFDFRKKTLKIEDINFKGWKVGIEGNSSYKRF